MPVDVKFLPQDNSQDSALATAVSIFGTISNVLDNKKKLTLDEQKLKNQMDNEKEELGIKKMTAESTVAKNQAEINALPAKMQRQAEQDLKTQLEIEQLKNNMKTAKSKVVKEQSELEIPGIGFAKTVDEAKQGRQAAEAHNSLSENVSSLMKLRNDNKDSILLGGRLSPTATTKANFLVAQIGLQTKKLENLGVLSATDYTKVLDKVIQSPFSFDPRLDVDAQLTTLQSSANQKLKAKMQAIGALPLEADLPSRFNKTLGSELPGSKFNLPSEDEFKLQRAKRFGLPGSIPKGK